MIETRAAVERMIRIFESGDTEGLRSLMCEDGHVRNPFATMDRESFPAFARAFCDAISERRMEVLDLVEAGDGVAVEIRVHGRHTGTLALPTGEAPPTGRPIAFRELGFVRVRDGRVASWHSYYDTLEVAAQLAPAEAAMSTV